MERRFRSQVDPTARCFRLKPTGGGVRCCDRHRHRVLTVDLDAIVANWRKLEKPAVPAECAGVIKADA